MQISYGRPELKQCCLKLEAAEERFGRTYADRLIRMFADAEAFENAGEWHEILGDEVGFDSLGSFQVAIGSRYMAHFVAVDKMKIVDADGRTDWSAVEYLKLTEISGI